MTTLRAAITLSVAAGSAAAFPPYLTEWRNQYPTSTLPSQMIRLTGSACNVCHHPPSRSELGTCYRTTLIDFLNLGQEIADAIRNAHNIDSDADGTPNGVEILTPRDDEPGEIGYHPGLRGPTGVDPCHDFPLAPVTNRAETPPPPCRPDWNGDGVVDFNDFLEFLNDYNAGVPRADLNQDGIVDFNDFLEFLNLYNAGC
ncbi:MAG: hypothetical protein FJ255_05550 [Phycisphaerae bacterium]|nr:hypothetical protein [Phycisphaerae bacterium]